MSELITLPEGKKVLEIFSEKDGLIPYIEMVESEAAKFVGSVETDASRDELAAFANKITQAKKHLDDSIKAQAAELNALVKRITANRKAVRERLGWLHDKVRLPLTHYELDKKWLRTHGSPRGTRTATVLATWNEAVSGNYFEPKFEPDRGHIDIDPVDAFDSLDDEEFAEAFCDDMCDDYAVQRMNNLLHACFVADGPKGRYQCAKKLCDWFFTLPRTGDLLHDEIIEMQDIKLESMK